MIPSAPSGLYNILLPSGVHEVYCEMTINRGGYTFISKTLVNKLKPEDLSVLFRTRKEVLLIISQPNNVQSYTIIKPINQTSFSSQSLQLSKYSTFTQPKNINMAPYLFLGITPAVFLEKGQMDGFNSNHKNFQFKNCDGERNSYFSFFSNSRNTPPSQYLNYIKHFEMNGLAIEWRNSAVKIPQNQNIPQYFFMFTEVHFGGCGTYTSSDRWLKSNAPAFGTAIGVK